MDVTGLGLPVLGMGSMAFFGTVLVLPLWLQSYQGYSALWAGRTMAFGGMLAVVLGPVVGANRRSDPTRVGAYERDHRKPGGGCVSLPKASEPTVRFITTVRWMSATQRVYRYRLVGDEPMGARISQLPVARESYREVAAQVVGSQVVLDLYDCETEHLDDLPWVRETLVEAARLARATIVQTCFHKFSPWGISGVIVIAESHIAIHVWPDKKYAAIDVFTCGSDLGLTAAVNYLATSFASGRVVQRSFDRGGHA